jgi:hypothetical protein
VESYPTETAELRNALKPLVLVEVRFEDFERWINKPKDDWEFSDVAEFSRQVLHQRALQLFEGAKEKDQTRIIPLEYIHLVLTEVGNDKANDFASVFRVSETPGFERNEPLVENEKLFYEYGMAVSAAYAIKFNVNSILFTKKKIR